MDNRLLLECADPGSERNPSGSAGFCQNNFLAESADLTFIKSSLVFRLSKFQCSLNSVQKYKDKKYL